MKQETRTKTESTLSENKHSDTYSHHIFHTHNYGTTKTCSCKKKYSTFSEALELIKMKTGYLTAHLIWILLTAKMNDREFFSTVQQYNLYAIQCDANKALNLTTNELEQLLGTLVYMSSLVCPQPVCFGTKTPACPK